MRLLPVLVFGCMMAVPVFAGAAAEETLAQLLTALEKGTDKERERAGHAIWAAVRYRKFGDLPTEEVVARLNKALGQPNREVRLWVIQALAEVSDEKVIPVLMANLKDQDPSVCGFACKGLRRFGAKAEAAIPALTAGVRDGRLRGAGWEALAAIQGKEATPTILAALERGKLDQHDRFSAVVALLECADPRSAAFMTRMLDDQSDPTTTLRAALYFAKFDDDAALNNLRRCLGYSPIEDRTRGLWVPPTTAASIRAVAAEYLGKHKDKESYERILRLAQSDPVIKVRTAAVGALGHYGDPKAIPALMKSLAEKDAGYSAEGHVDGTLRQTTVQALARIGTPEALTVLYDGLAAEHARRQCADFWATAGKEHLDTFIKLYDRRPIDAQLAAGVIHALVRKHGPVALTAQGQQDAEKAFVKAVQDPAHFGMGADLSRKGQFRFTIDYLFFTADFAVVSFQFRDIRPNGYGHGYTVLYRKSTDRWLPLGKVLKWVE